MTQDLDDWGRRAAQLPAVLVHATPSAVRTGAEALAEQARAGLTRASGGDLRLSRVRSGKGARVDVDVKVRGAGSSASAVVVPVGPVSLVENDTAGHRQPFQYAGATGEGGKRRYSMNRRKKAARRERGQIPMRIPGAGWRTGPWQHPGTRGRHPVANAMHTHADAAGVAGAEVFTDAVRRHLAG